MRKLIIVLLVSACTSAYATDNRSENNNVSGYNNIVDSSIVNNSGPVTNVQEYNSQSISSAKSVSEAKAIASAMGGKSVSNATGGKSVSNATGGTATGGAGGSAVVNAGDSNATGGNVKSNITVAVGCTYDCAPSDSTSKDIADSRNATDRDIADRRASADKEIAAGHDKALVDAANSKIRNTPSMFSPPLVSSNDTCMGSTSGSVAAPGLGIGFGTAWVDENCKMLKNSQALWNMGYRAASIALMCNDDKIKQALEITGYICPIKETKNTNVVVSKPYEQ